MSGNGNGRRVGFWRYWNGRWRLRYGVCPLCNSSPPRSCCPVCQGSYRYGPNISDSLRAKWRSRFDAIRRTHAEPS